MSFSVVNSRAINGIKAPEVQVEVHLANGLPSFTIGGLPETAIKESRDRVRSAISNSNFDFPVKRIIVNLAPADLPKEGAGFDLPIAIGILLASHQLPLDQSDLENIEFIGELSLNGMIRGVAGILPVAHSASNKRRILALPDDNIDQAALISNLSLLSSSTLTGMIEKLAKRQLNRSDDINQHTFKPHQYPDFADVKGQSFARRALEIAACGQHNLLMVGPPGCGKTMLATRMPGILPALSKQKAIETASLYSVSRQGFDIKNWQRIPIRSPHHSCSAVSLIGGGVKPVPGEISLAHNGILFLDELSQFDTRALEMLREPLESGYVNIARVNQSQTYLADILLLAATNPCHCGNLGSSIKQCRCSPALIERYRNKFSGPLIDRFDMHIELQALSASELMSEPNGQSTLTIAKRVTDVRDRQLTRQGKLNDKLSGTEIEQEIRRSSDIKSYLFMLVEKLNLTARTYHRILKVSRTIADMDQCQLIKLKHINEAIHYRRQNNS